MLTASLSQTSQSTFGRFWCSINDQQFELWSTFALEQYAPLVGLLLQCVSAVVRVKMMQGGVASCGYWSVCRAVKRG